MAKEHFQTKKPHVNVSRPGTLETPNLVFYIPEVSQLGQSQLLNGQIVTNPNDRQAIANTLRLLSSSPVAQMALRQAAQTQLRKGGAFTSADFNYKAK